jgi:hypothetical protein
MPKDEKQSPKGVGVNRNEESLPTKPGKLGLKKLPNGRLWLQAGIYNKHKHKQKQTQTETQNADTYKKRLPETARVKHAPSPGTFLATDDFHKLRSAPSETGENSCSPHTQKQKNWNVGACGSQPTMDEQHSLEK